MRSTMLRRAVTSGACGVLLLGGAAVGVAAPAAAAACDSSPSNEIAPADFDGDGAADIAVGMPYYADGSGAVELRGTKSPPLLLRSGDFGGGTGEGDRFGSAIAIGDLDQDGCADLVISAPAEGQSDVSDGAGNNEGQVHILFGAVGGLDPRKAVTLPHDSSNLDQFGTALSLTARTVVNDTTHDLYVGAPSAEVGGQSSAGEVFRYRITPDPATRIKVTLREVRSQDSPGVPGAAESGDEFGSALATGLNGGALVGAPGEDVGSVRDAGAIWQLGVNSAGAATASQTWSQDSPGVAGSPETDDHFGAVISARINQAVVGVPDEDSGAKVDSGMIQTFVANAAGTFSPDKPITQDTAGVPGALEAGDRFGAAVAVGAALTCQEAVEVAVGVPGEDIGTRADAGGIALVPLQWDFDCPATSVRQGSGLAGAAEAGDQVGSVLGLIRGHGIEEDYADRLLVGVPREDIGAQRDAGMVQPAKGAITANGKTVASLTYSKGYLLENYYGAVLSTQAGN